MTCLKGNKSDKKAKQQLLNDCKLIRLMLYVKLSQSDLKVLGNAFLLDPATISRLEALTPADFTDSSENLNFLLDSAAMVWNKESMAVSSTF